MMNAHQGVAAAVDFGDAAILLILEFAEDMRRQASAEIEPEYRCRQ